VIPLASSSLLFDQFLQLCKLNFCSFSCGSSLFGVAYDLALVACDILIINMTLCWSMIIMICPDRSCVVPRYR